MKQQQVTCRICGAKLTNPESIKRGIGPECFATDTVNRAFDRVQDALMKAGFHQRRHSPQMEADNISCKEIFVDRQAGMVKIVWCSLEDTQAVIDWTNRLLRATKFRVDDQGVIRYVTGDRLIPAPPTWTPAEIAALMQQAETRILAINTALQDINKVLWFEDDGDPELEAEQQTLQAEKDRIKQLRHYVDLNTRAAYVRSRQIGGVARKDEEEMLEQRRETLSELQHLVA